MTSPTRPIRLVVSDVDGTLVQHDHSLAPSTIAAVGRLRAAGVKLALVSSRPAHGLDVLLQPLGIDTPRAGFNGGEILAPDDTLLREHIIAPEISRQVVAAMEAAGVAAWVFSDGTWLLRDPDGPYVQREFNSISLPWQVVNRLFAASDAGAQDHGRQSGFRADGAAGGDVAGARQPGCDSVAVAKLLS